MPQHEIIDVTLTLTRNPAKPYLPRDTGKLRWIVLHHSAGPATQTPEEIARYHVQHNGWSGIGYNYLIYQNGKIYKTRPIGVIPVCVENHNTESVCICFVGDFTAHPPSVDALDAGAWLIGLLRQSYPQVQGVRGHKEMPDQATSCPGPAFDVISYRAQLGVPA